MPSSLSSLLPFLSSTSLALAAVAGCSDDAQCGAGTVPTDGVVLAPAGSSATITYGGLTSLDANDCPDLTDENRPTSITIEGAELGGMPGIVTLCIPRPDRMNGTLSLGNPLTAGDLLFIDLTGTVDGCSYGLDFGVAPTGTATAAGACDNATNPAGFALTLDATLGMERTCGASPAEPIAVTVSGTVAVGLRNP